MKYRIKQTTVLKEPDGEKLTKDDVRNIRIILCLPQWSRMPRCPAKSKTFVRKQEEKGDFSHSHKRHICDQCRCHHAAGLWTKGNFYGLGEHTGHYGCGWCAKHEMGPRKRWAEEFAVQHMRLLQGVGMGQTAQEDYALQVHEEARVATARREVRSQIDLIRQCAEKFHAALAPEDPGTIDALTQELKNFNGLLATNGFLTKEELKAAMEIIGMAIAMRAGMTEKGRSGPIPMSDDTKMKNMREWAKLIADLSLDEYKVTEGDYVRSDEVKTRLAQTVSVLQRFVPTKDDWDKLTNELRIIWSNLRGGK